MRIGCLWGLVVDAAEHRFFAEGGIEAIAGVHLGIADGSASPIRNAEAVLRLGQVPGTAIRRAVENILWPVSGDTRSEAT